MSQRFAEIVERHGWQGWTGSESKAGTYWRTRVIYRTNLSTSFAAGRLAQLQHFPLWVYKHSGAEHPRLQHQAWDGLTLPADHEFWRTHYPPNGWNCFPGDTIVRCDALLGQRIWYAGEMVELHTAFGHRLSVTAHHPVLTRRGWVAAKDIEQGDELISASLHINAPLRGVVNHEQPPARAEDLFEALAAQRLRVVPVSPDDFYGDARAMEGEIHIAGSDCPLMHEIEAARRELGGKGRFDGALHRRIESADIALRAAQVAPVAAQATPAQHVEHGGLGQSETPTNGGGRGHSAAVEAQDGALGIGIAGVGDGPGAGEHPFAPSLSRLDLAPGHAVGVGASAQGDAGLFERVGDGAAAGAVLFGQLLDAGAGRVARDEVVEVRKYEWAGHVYDFTTSTGLIMAGGLIVSNCGCRVVGASSEKGAARLGAKPGYTTPPPGWDVPDAKGRLPGIDEGWDYQPGGTVLCKDAHANGGGRQCADMRKLDAFLRKLPGQPALIGAQMVDAWPPHVFDLLAVRFGQIADDLIANRRPQGRSHFVGAMRAAWVRGTMELGATIKTAELTVRDQDITHAMRPAKVKDGKAVDPLWYRSLPLHLRAPQATLLRRSPKQEMLMIYDSGSDKAKIVVLVDYRGEGLNVVRTASRLIETDTLRAQVALGELALLEGGL